MKRIHNNYRTIIGVNGGLIALGVTGVIMPTTSALLHNMSTLTISLRSMRNLLPKEVRNIIDKNNIKKKHYKEETL